MRTVGLGPIERVGEANVVLPSLAGVQWMDLQEIAEKLGLSRERVRQIELQALASLRRYRSRVREYLVI